MMSVTLNGNQFVTYSTCQFRGSVDFAFYLEKKCLRYQHETLGYDSI